MERHPQDLLDQAVSMHATLSCGPKAEHTEEVLSRLRGRIATLDLKCKQTELQDVLRIHSSLDEAEIPEDSRYRAECQNALLASMVRLGRQIPTPATT